MTARSRIAWRSARIGSGRVAGTSVRPVFPIGYLRDQLPGCDDEPYELTENLAPVVGADTETEHRHVDAYVSERQRLGEHVGVLQ